MGENKRSSSLQLTFHPSYDSPSLKEQIQHVVEGRIVETKAFDSSAYARVLQFESLLDGEKKLFIFKQFLFRNLRDRLSVLFRKSRAMRAWTGGRILLDQGFCTAVPVCVGEEKNLGMIMRSFLVTEALKDAQGVDQYLRNVFSETSSPGDLIQKRKFLKLLGKTIGHMHCLNIFQGDLRAGNILIQDGDPPGIHLIDNERTVQYRKLPDRKRLKNLVQMNLTLLVPITRTDRVRFYYAYLEENPELKPLKKLWMRKVLEKTRARMVAKDWLDPVANRLRI